MCLDIIIDASMPAMIRTSGQMWNAKGNYKIQKQSFLTVLMQEFIQQLSTSARNMEHLIQQQWEQFLM